MTAPKDLGEVAMLGQPLAEIGEGEVVASPGGAPPVDAERPVAPFQATPDGRPYLVAMPDSPGYFVATEDRSYVFVREPLVKVELSRHWPALRVTVPVGNRIRPMRPVELYERYGAPAQEVRYAYGVPTAYESGAPGRGTLRIGVPLTTGPAVCSERCASFLRLLGGDSESRLLDWLATVHRVERPTAVLILRGTTSIGKGMLATALATLAGGFIAYGEAMGRFNAGLLAHWLVWLDEASTVNVLSEVFRSLFTNATHRVEGKNRPLVTLSGCPRLLVTTNSDDPLRLADHALGLDDEEAIGRRVLVIRCDPAAGAYLRKLGGRTATEGWCDPDGELVKHLRWIAATRKVVPGDRLWVEGDSAAWAAAAATRGGVVGRVAHAIRSFIDQTHELGSGEIAKRYRGETPCVWLDTWPGHVLVSPQRLRRDWSMVVGAREFGPSMAELSRALQRLSGRANPVRTKLSDGSRLCVYPVLAGRLPSAGEES